jgi:hypothetical protein
MKALRDTVWQRAQGRCEYCQMPQHLVDLRHQLDHIVAEQHRGATTENNLALACYSCNKNKGPNISSVDPATEQKTGLFNPRTDTWSEHFRWTGAFLQGLTPVGRATVELLRINSHDRVDLRQSLIAEGLFPPVG